MHPVIAQFLDPKAVISALEKAARHEALSQAEELFVAAAAAHPERKARALKAGTSTQMEDQQAALALAVFAALAQSETDPVLSPVIQAARRALAEAGATPDDIQQFLSLVLLEEAFAFDDEADTFDTDLVVETFRTLPRLAALDEEKINAIEETFAQQVPAAGRPLQLATAQALFSAAWSDGPVPVSPEHVEAALEQLRGQTSDAEFEAAAKALRTLLQLMAREGLVGLQRLKKLLDSLEATALSLSLPAGEGADDEIEDEDEGADEDFADEDDDATDPGEGTRN